MPTGKTPCTHKVYHFKSAAGGVRVPLNHPPGSLIEVRINPKNPRRYEVVLDSMSGVMCDMMTGEHIHC